MIKSQSFLILLTFIAIGYSSCSSERTEKGKPVIGQKKARAPQETRTMVQILDSINRYSTPEVNYHMNKAMAHKIEQQIQEGASDRPAVQLYFDLARELLQSGDTQEAIQLIEELLVSSGGLEQEITPRSKPWFDLLAISYLRQGEQENCLKNHNSFSCFVPLQGPGVYKVKNWSETAIELYSKILSKFPDDHQSKWLINVAYMSVGKYPSGVPTEWLISMPDERAFPRMKESAMKMGIMRMGLSGGAIIDDFNGDGWPDVFCTSYWLYDNVKLYLSENGERFIDATENAGLFGITSGLNCMQVDYDNDGDLDIFVLRGAWLKEGGNHPNSLLRNDGSGVFEDVTISAGLLSFRPTQNATWSDLDLDGDLDVFIGNESTKGVSHECEYFQNNGDGTFTEKAAEVGLDISGWIKGSNAGDINNDGRPDIYVSDLQGKNHLFLNEPVGNGFRMQDVSNSAGVEAPLFSFPCWFFDVNNDGYEDIFVSGYDVEAMGDVAGQSAKEYLGLATQAEKMKLYINNGNLTFRDATEEYGLDKVAFTMGSNFGDVNNDGFPDIYLGTGAPDLGSVVPNRLFINEHGEQFSEVTVSAGVGNIQKGHGVAFGDIDLDGDQDIYCTMGGAYQGDTYPDLLLLSENDQGNWISIDLQGSAANSFGVGARLELIVENDEGEQRKIFHTVGSGGSFGANSLTAEIGLGQCQKIRSLKVIWPDKAKSTQILNDIDPDQRIRIVQGQNEFIAI